MKRILIKIFNINCFVLFIFGPLINIEASATQDINITALKEYLSNNKLKIHNVIDFKGLDLTAIGYRIDLPLNWTYMSVEGQNVPDVKKFSTPVLEFAWFNIPVDDSIMSFSYLIRLPDGKSNKSYNKELSFTTLYRDGAGTEQQKKSIMSRNIDGKISSSLNENVSATIKLLLTDTPEVEVKTDPNGFFYTNDFTTNASTVDLIVYAEGYETYTTTVALDLNNETTTVNIELTSLAPEITLIYPSEGNSGETVTINGKYFDDNAIVVFDTQYNAISKMVSTNEIICIAPEHSDGSVDVKVENPDGKFDIIIDGFTYQQSVCMGEIIGSITPNIPTLLNTSIIEDVESEPSGDFSIPHIEGTYTLFAYAEGYKSYMKEVTIKCMQQTYIDITLIPQVAVKVPNLISPIDDSKNESLTPVLKTEKNQDNDVLHISTQWQIAIDPEFTIKSCIFDITSSSSLTELNVPIFLLKKNSTYYWRVIYYYDSGNVDNTQWAQPFSFSTISNITEDMNSNGIPDKQEIENSIDIDNDGNSDINQADMKCLNTITNSSYIGLKILNNANSIESIKSISIDSIAESINRPNHFPMDILCFKLNVEKGDTATVNIYFSEKYSKWAKWYKYDLIKGWYDYSEHTTYNDNYITIKLKDGGVGDVDGLTNGVIIDPSGLAELENYDSQDLPTNQDEDSGGCFFKTIFLPHKP